MASAKLEKLKEKLAKQKKQDVKIVTVLKKERKDKKIIPAGQKQFAQRSAEEDAMRKNLELILEEKYLDIKGTFDLFKKDMKEKEKLKPRDSKPEEDNNKTKPEEEEEEEDGEKEDNIQIAWEELQTQDKQEYALQAISNQKELFTRQNLINNLLNLNKKLQDNFIQKYLAQKDTYTEFYKLWSEDAVNRKKILKLTAKRDVETLQIKDSNKRDKQIIEDLKTRARELAKEKGKDVEGITHYHKMLRKIDKKKFSKLHKKLASDYITLARLIEMPLSSTQEIDTLDVADLAGGIAKREGVILAGNTPEDVRLVRQLPRKKLVKRVGQIGVENPDSLPDNTLQMVLLLNSMKENKKPEVAPEKHPMKRIVPTGINLDEKELEQKYKDVEDEEEKKILISKEILEAEYTDEDKLNLANKLSRITGQSKEGLLGLSVNQLQKQYQKLEDGDEYWEEYQRDSVIQEVSKMSGKKPIDFKDMKTEKLIEELERLTEEKGQRINRENLRQETMLAKKCVRDFRQYKWINANVSGVWLAIPRGKNIGSIRDYIRKDDTIEADIPSLGKVRFYHANVNFFTLQCNRYAHLRKQEDTTLWCLDMWGNSIGFIVAYSISGTKSQLQDYLEGGRSYLVTYGTHIGERMLLQDEQLFEKEKEVLGQQETTEKKEISSVLKSKISAKSLDVVAQFLSTSLLTVAPKNPDYGYNPEKREDFLKLKGMYQEENRDIEFKENVLVSSYNTTNTTPYIRIAIDTLVKREPEQTNRDLFTGVAEVISYLKLSSAESFRDRVKGEYYLPDVLVTLSPEDKLPEIFNDRIGEETKALMSSHIMTIVATTVRNMARNFLNITKTVETIDVSSEPSAKFDKEFCENKDEAKDIPEEDLVVYKDPDDSKIYCFDVKKLSGKFEEKEYINPATGKKFSREFIYRYTVSYLDQDDQGEYKTYTFPVQKLYKQLKEGNTINPMTGRQFDSKFVQSVLEKPETSDTEVKYVDVEEKDGNNFKTFVFPYKQLYKQFKEGNIVNPSTGREFSRKFVDVVLSSWQRMRSDIYTGKKFKRLDYRLRMCENPQDVLDTPISNIIYYSDADSGKMYCFPINKVAEILKTDEANPYTGRKFSKKFIRRFNKTFNMDLKKGGLLQPVFQDKYQFFVKKNPIPTFADPYAEPKERTLLIPNLWKIILRAVEKQEKALDMDILKDVQEGEEIEEKKSQEEDEETTDEDEETTDDETTDEDEEEEKPKEEDSKEEESKEEDSKSKEVSVSSKEEKGSESDGETSAKASFGMGTTKDCMNCKKSVDGTYKTISFDGTDVQTHHFCDLKCMENTKFPKYKKK